jgi:hypothetical protein
MPEVKLIPFTQFETVNSSIKPARGTIPDWYKGSPRRLEENSLNLNFDGVSNATYKQCAPFLDGMTIGYMAVLTSDIEISLGENNLPFINHKPLERHIVTIHSPEQWEGMPYPLFHYPSVFKWHQDLLIKTPKNYSLLFTHPMNRLDLPFTTISGVVDTDSYCLPTHFPFWVKQGFTGVVKAGTPVCQIIPILRGKWTKSLQDFNPNEALINKDNYLSTIVKAYKSLFWQKKTYD